MKIAVSTIDEFQIVEITGVVDRNAAGAVYDALVEAAGDGRRKLVVDLSGVRHMTRAGTRGFVVAAKLMRPGQGEMRICGASRATEALLRGLGHFHLLKCDPTIEMSILSLSYASEPDVLPIREEELGWADTMAA